MQKNMIYSTTIVAIFRPADPMREILRDYASCKGCAVLFYDHQIDAISRMPIASDAHATLIASRPEGLSSGGMAAFDMLTAKDTTHYALWVEHGEHRHAAGHSCHLNPVHSVENLHQFDALVKSLDSVGHRTPPLGLGKLPVSSGRLLNIPNVPLSAEELDALLEVGL